MTSTVPVWQAELSKASTRGKNIMMMVCITPPIPSPRSDLFLLARQDLLTQI